MAEIKKCIFVDLNGDKRHTHDKCVDDLEQRVSDIEDVIDEILKRIKEITDNEDITQNQFTITFESLNMLKSFTGGVHNVDESRVEC